MRTTSCPAGSSASRRPSLNWSKPQGAWESWAELDEAAHCYTQQLAARIMDNGVFIGGDGQNFYRLHRYAEKHYVRTMR